MAGGFDPYLQVFTIVGPDGQTRIPVSMPVLNWYYLNNVRLAISYSAQACVAGIMILVVLFMTERSKLTRPSMLLNLVGLGCCLINRLLLTLYFTGPFANIYSVFASDFSAVPRSQYANSIAATTVGTILLIVVESALMYQAWTLLRTWPKLPKYIVGIVSLALVLVVLGFRFTSMVYQNLAVLHRRLPLGTVWILKTTVILSSVSIFWFCALFNLRLVTHLVKNRGVLPSRSTLNPMEILVIVNGLLMTIPVVFAGIQWSDAGNSFESASWAYTAVVVILPLGTLIAQRVTNSAAAAAIKSPSNQLSGWTPKLFGSTKAGSTIPMSSITSHAEASLPKAAKDTYDRELADIDDGHSGSIHKNHVRVHHDVDQTERRI